MKFGKILLGVFALLVIGGFVALALMDVPVKSAPVTKTIPNERFFNAD